MIDSILDALGYVGDSLDKAGPRPLRGLLAGKPREALSFVPFSDEMGLTDPNDIRTGRHVTDNLGITDSHDKGWGAIGLGMMADALIDPVALGGTAMAGRAGLKSLMRDIHGPRRGFMNLAPFPGHSKQVNDAADWLGPMHNPVAGERTLMGGIGKRAIAVAGKQQDPRDLEYYHKLMGLDEPTKQRLFSELPEGSEMIAHGGEGIVFRSPEQGIIKIQPAKSTFNASGDHSYHMRTGQWPSTGRLDAPEMLRPIRSNQFGDMEKGLVAEHMHQVTPLFQQRANLDGNLSDILSTLPTGSSPEGYGMRRQIDSIKEIDNVLARHMSDRLTTNHGLTGDQLSPWDVTPSNLSLTPQGKLVIHDSGAVTGSNSSILPFPTPAQPSEEMIRSLMGMGSPHAVRDAMSQSLTAPSHSGIDIPTELLDRSSGMVHRDLLPKRQAAIKALEDYIRDHQHVIEQARGRQASTPNDILAAVLGGFTDVSSAAS